jgi:hypothetical protein
MIAISNSLGISANRVQAKPELITNPNFDTDLSGYTLEAGAIVDWVGGLARITVNGSGQNIGFGQGISTVIGVQYSLAVTIAAASLANALLRIGTVLGGGTILSATIPRNTTTNTVFTATATTTFITIRPNTTTVGFTANVDRLSVK